MEVSKDSKAHITCIRHCHVNNRDRLCRADFTLFVIFRNWPEAKIRKQGKKQHSILQPYRILRMVAAALLIHNIIGNWHTIMLLLHTEIKKNQSLWNNIWAQYEQCMHVYYFLTDLGCGLASWPQIYIYVLVFFSVCVLVCLTYPLIKFITCPRCPASTKTTQYSPCPRCPASTKTNTFSGRWKSYANPTR